MTRCHRVKWSGDVVGPLFHKPIEIEESARWFRTGIVARCTKSDLVASVRMQQILK